MLLKFKNKIFEKDCKITYSYDGNVTLEFELTKDEFVTCEEVFTISNENKFIVKSIDEYIVTCELDFTELKKDIFNGIKKFESQSLNDTLHQLLDKYNWQISNAQSISKRRTLELEDENVISAVFKCQKLYECTFQFDCLNKHLKVIDEPNKTNFIISDDINLISFSIKSDTYEHYTRIYGYGKDGLSFKTINNGNEYVDNFNYNKNIIPVIFRDDRFTDSESLKKHCQELLKKHAFPLLEYELAICELKNLNNTQNKLKLHDEVIFLNTKTKRKEKHRIIEYVKYSDDPSKNEIKLINRSGNLTEFLSDYREEISSEIKKEIGKFDFKTLFDESISKLTERWEKLLINGYKIETENATYYVDRLPKEEAVNVLKIGLGGIMGSSNGWNGNFELAISNDGQINADRILTGYLNVDRIKARSITADKLTVGAKEEIRKGLISENNFNNFIVNNNVFQSEVGSIVDKKVKEINIDNVDVSDRLYNLVNYGNFSEQGSWSIFQQGEQQSTHEFVDNKFRININSNQLNFILYQKIYEKKGKITVGFDFTRVVGDILPGKLTVSISAYKDGKSVKAIYHNIESIGRIYKEFDLSNIDFDYFQLQFGFKTISIIAEISNVVLLKDDRKAKVWIPSLEDLTRDITKIANENSKQITRINQTVGDIELETSKKVDTKYFDAELQKLLTLAEENSTKLNQNSERILIQAKKVVELHEKLTEKVNREEMETWFEFSVSGLKIGRKGSNIKLNITNEKLSYVVGGKENSYWTNEAFYILTTMKIGEFSIITEEDGSLSIV